MEYDLIIAGGSVIDGSGADANRADIAISGGRIERIGDLSGEAAKTRWMPQAKLSLGLR